MQDTRRAEKTVRATSLQNPARVTGRNLGGGGAQKEERTMMRLTTPLVLACAALVALPASVAAFPVTWGTSWDGPGNDLQSLVDAYLGTNAINVALDYIGHDTSDPDPYYWRIGGFSSYMVREIAGNADSNVFGWYRRPAAGAQPVINGVDDGVIFPGPAGEGSTYTLDLLALYGSPVQIGFYLAAPAYSYAPSETFFSDRRYNDLGWGGVALHAPYDGDPQMLAYDLSSIRGYESYLLAWEDRDTGGLIQYQTDNDFNDMIVEITPTPAIPEPSTLLLLGSGLAAAVFFTRKRAARC
jgi:hypothetical protein